MTQDAGNGADGHLRRLRRRSHVQRGSAPVIGIVLLLVVTACSETTSGPTSSATTGAPTSTTQAAGTSSPPATTTTTAGEVDLVAVGMSLAARNGCAACHSAEGTPTVGPTWKGLAGSEKTFDDGSTVVVDEEYLRRSILDPDAQIVEGFVAGVMPQTFADNLSETDLDAILAYIDSLG